MDHWQLEIDKSLGFIASRRSVYPKDFTAIELTKDQLQSLLSAASYAPTHKLTEPWYFVGYINDRIEEFRHLQTKVLKETIIDERNREVKLKKLDFKCGQSAAVVAIIMKRDSEKRVPQWEEISAVSCAVQNIWLHAESHGLSGYWSSGTTANHIIVRRHFGLVDEDLHLGWLFLGGIPEGPRRKRSRKDPRDFMLIK